MLQARWKRQLVAGDLLGNRKRDAVLIDQRVGQGVPEAMKAFEALGQPLLDRIGTELIPKRVAIAVFGVVGQVREQSLKACVLDLIHIDQEPSLDQGCGQGHKTGGVGVLQALVRLGSPEMHAPEIAHLADVVDIELSDLVDPSTGRKAQQRPKPSVRILLRPGRECIQLK